MREGSLFYVKVMNSCFKQEKKEKKREKEKDDKNNNKNTIYYITKLYILKSSPKSVPVCRHDGQFCRFPWTSLPGGFRPLERCIFQIVSVASKLLKGSFIFIHFY